MICDVGKTMEGLSCDVGEGTVGLENDLRPR